MKKTVKDIAGFLKAGVVGDENHLIEGIAPLDEATLSDISFLSSAAFEKSLSKSSAGAVIVQEKFAASCKTTAIIHPDPYRCFAAISEWFSSEPAFEQGIAKTAIVDPTASIADSASICDHAVIGANVTIGENSVVESGSVIQKGAVIGNDCHIYPNVTLYHDVVLGDEVEVHSGTVIGSDGFGFAPDPKGTRKWHKIHQLGTVIIGDRVDIGSSTTIDRGALGDTRIENDVIIDSQVHIGHNCVVGEGSALAGCVGLAGSSIIGKGCLLAGGVGIAGHLSIPDGSQITGMTMVTKSLSKPGSYSSGTPMMTTRDWKKSAIRFSQLDEMAKRLKQLEKQLAELSHKE
ncbi:MAG: UDP-3-O-(3-hydroxymyristoyl)glucosamine N-acyltransferase [Cellvibrionales bacterium]|nr:UDP-3-O-(3-hydroxymyristoyl)glucosamine N-acyltransferase [Cellvibrionales bacterium]